MSVKCPNCGKYVIAIKYKLEPRTDGDSHYIGGHAVTPIIFSHAGIMGCVVYPKELHFVTPAMLAAAKKIDRLIDELLMPSDDYLCKHEGVHYCEESVSVPIYNEFKSAFAELLK